MDVIIIPKIEDRCNKMFHEFVDFDFWNYNNFHYLGNF